MFAGRGDFERAFRTVLAPHLGQIGRGGRLQRRRRRCPGQPRAALKRPPHLAQIVGQLQTRPANQPGLQPIGGGQDQFMTRRGAGDQRGQQLARLAQLAAQGQFPIELASLQGASGQLSARGQNPDGDRQIEAAALLRQIGRSPSGARL